MLLPQSPTKAAATLSESTAATTRIRRCYLQSSTKRATTEEALGAERKSKGKGGGASKSGSGGGRILCEDVFQKFCDDWEKFVHREEEKLGQEN